jgi:hypothetical protein
VRGGGLGEGSGGDVASVNDRKCGGSGRDDSGWEAATKGRDGHGDGRGIGWCWSVGGGE